MKKRKSITPNETKKSLIFLLVFAFLIGIGVLVTNLLYWKSYMVYPARITNITQGNGRGTAHSERWNVEYLYTIENKTYKGSEIFFSKSEYGDRYVGDTINVDVSSKDASVSRWRP